MSQSPHFSMPNIDPVPATRRSVPATPLLLWALLLSLLLLAGCTAAGGLPLAISATPSAEQTFGGAIESVLNYSLPPTPVPTPTSEAPIQIIVATGGSRANVRSGPSLDASIVGKGDPDQAFDVVGRSEDGAWWQITLPDGTEGWISNSIVRVAGEGETVAVTASSEPVIPSDLRATWDIDWSCESEEGRCTVQQCDATVTAGVNREGDSQYIPVEYQVEWADECFSTDAWVFEVDPFTGSERSGEYADNFLYAYWAGAGSGKASGVLPFGSDEGIVVSCAGPQTVEIEEGDGWTSVYEGVTCHDRNTGMLVYMNYIKRWLFTGEFEGQNYDRAFFGDVERLEQRLTDTNAELFLVKRK